MTFGYHFVLENLLLGNALCGCWRKEAEWAGRKEKSSEME